MSRISSQGSPAYERNREPILQVLQKVLGNSERKVFEIGSGSGHHAVWMAKHLPKIQWTTADLLANHEMIVETLSEEKLPNVYGPVEFEAGRVHQSFADYDVVFSANTLHIMSEKNVKILIQLLGETLKAGAEVLFYGPFNDGPNFTSPSNADFEQWLKSVDPERGIRAYQDIQAWMKLAGFELKNRFEMPSNNFILHFLK